MIETYGYVTAVEAADAALKAADVRLADLQFVKGGLVAIIFTGDVAAVKASADAGEAAGNRIGKVISTHVIARPDSGTNTLYGKRKKKQGKNITKASVSVKKTVKKATVPGRKKMNKQGE